jgi:hypothetical protein
MFCKTLTLARLDLHTQCYTRENIHVVSMLRTGFDTSDVPQNLSDGTLVKSTAEYLVNRHTFQFGNPQLVQFSLREVCPTRQIFRRSSNCQTCINELVATAGPQKTRHTLLLFASSTSWRLADTRTCCISDSLGLAIVYYADVK